MGATFMAEDGSEQPFLMGCYGVGVSRAMAAIVEQHNDEHGIAWPLLRGAGARVRAPAHRGRRRGAARRREAGRPIWRRLGLEVAIDDRKERAGVKFADADLVGWPLQVVVGKRGLAERQGGDQAPQARAPAATSRSTALTDALAFAQRNAKVWGSEVSLFGALFE